MPRHPLTDEFLRLLGRQGGDWALARRSAFQRICEAWSDDEGLPAAGGLRQIERGQYDSHLGEDWKPIFVDVYRRWLGFRMERQFLEPARPLSLAWWFTAPPFVRELHGGPLSRLLSPAVGLFGILAVLSALLAGPALGQHERRRSIASALERYEEARYRLETAEREDLARLDQASDAAIEAFLGGRGRLLSLGDQAERMRSQLAQRAGLELR